MILFPVPILWREKGGENPSRNSSLYRSFLDFFLQYNIANDNRLILVDIFIEKE
jgi:hypothetical protein